MSDNGLGRLTEPVRDARDRFAASDPGWARLRQGIRAFVAVGTTLLLELILARSLDRPAVTALLLGAVVAMLVSTGVRETERAVIARTVAVAPLIAATGTSLGVLTGEQRLLGLATFVVVSFFAVWVRRFGPRWFTLGFLFWQSFFFALFLHPPVATLPFLLVAIVVSSLWVGLLLLTVLYDDPQLKLRRIVRGLRARARAGIAAAAEVLGSGAEPKSVRQLRGQLVGLAEVALLLDGQLADARSLPTGVSPGRLRRWTVDVEIGMDELADATVQVAQRRAEFAPETLEAVQALLQSVGWADYKSAVTAARQLESPTQPGTVRRLASAAAFLLETVELWRSGDLTASLGPLDAQPADGAPAGHDVLDEDDGFEPAVTLVGGNLPGSAALAQQTLDVEGGRFSTSRLSLTTRQAVQAAVAAGLAIIAGELISPARFYWAVIAAFVAFAGTATSGETVRKGASRIGGTVLGLIAAVGLANITDDNQPAAIGLMLLCIFCAFFLQTVSYGAMIFFITVLLGQLYTLLGTFSDELLLVRLAETVAGAAIGIFVSLVVLPTHSRATLRVARRQFLQDLGDLLEACAETLEGRTPSRSPLTLTMVTEASARQLVRTRLALTRGRLFGSDRSGVRHRVSVLGTCGASARAFAAAITQHPPRGAAAVALARASREVAGEARRLAAANELGNPPALPTGTQDLLSVVRDLLDTVEVHSSGPQSDSGAVRSLRRLTDGLALLGRRPAGTG